jgi:hypothetical protein
VVLRFDPPPGWPPVPACFTPRNGYSADTMTSSLMKH